MSTTTPCEPPAVPSSAIVIAEAFSMDIAKRFFHLLTHSRVLVQVFGPYRMLNDTTVFARAAVPRSAIHPPSTDTLAKSLAIASESIHSAQPDGPAKEDLHVFKLLNDATVDLLEKILEVGTLELQAYGWGVYGLASGYIDSEHSPLEPELDIERFVDQKERLYEALKKLPKVNVPIQGGSKFVEMLESPTKLNREAHVCASLVMQRLRANAYVRVRWWHMVSVAERWAKSLGWEPVQGQEVTNQDGEIANGDDIREIIRVDASIDCADISDTDVEDDLPDGSED